MEFEDSLLLPGENVLNGRTFTEKSSISTSILIKKRLDRLGKHLMLDVDSMKVSAKVMGRLIKKNKGELEVFNVDTQTEKVYWILIEINLGSILQKTMILS